MRNRRIVLEKYVITKSLTRALEAYPDARNQPHVEVALRLKKSGHVTGCSAGDTVPYVICCEQGNGSVTSVGIAQRARHPDELKNDNGNWMVDIHYYLAQQELVKLSKKFGEHVLDVKKKFEKLITEKKDIEGFPSTALGLGAQTALSKGHENAYKVNVIM